MSDEFLEYYNKLSQERVPFATAIVVNRVVPSSGKPGDRAIIMRDGTIKGWIGGGCTRGIVLKEALLAIQQGKPRLVSITPDADKAMPKGVISYNMTCQSGGSVSVYIEPVLPKPHILVIGRSHIGMALARISKVTGYQVTAVAEGADKEAYPTADKVVDSQTLDTSLVKPGTFTIVCTQGENDAGALRQAIRSGSDYVAFVSSMRKANAIYRELMEQGVTAEELQKVKTPAGMNINAKLPEEVAISILAEIISIFRKENTSSAGKAEAQLNMKEYFINPVCNVPIQRSTAKHIIKYKDIDYYFCCDGCKISFEADPEKYSIKT